MVVITGDGDHTGKEDVTGTQVLGLFGPKKGFKTYGA